MEIIDGTQVLSFKAGCTNFVLASKNQEVGHPLIDN